MSDETTATCAITVTARDPETAAHAADLLLRLAREHGIKASAGPIVRAQGVERLPPAPLRGAAVTDGSQGAA